MVKVQEWLDKEYPKEERNSITKLDIRSKNLNGSLSLTDFANLEELDCSFNELTNLSINNCIRLKIINCNFNHDLITLEISNQPILVELNCGGNDKLTTLIVTNNPRLTVLACSYCNLTTLTLSSNPSLAKLTCSNNQLTKTSIDQSQKLITFDLNCNKFSSDLTWLENFTNLEELRIDNNSFQGSLQPLTKMKHLKVLDIDNTNLDSGLEYLPESLENFWCKGTKLAEILVNYEKPSNINHLFSLKNWKKKQLEEQNLVLQIDLEKEIEKKQKLEQELMAKKQEIVQLKNNLNIMAEDIELVKQLTNKEKEITNLRVQKETLQNELNQQIKTLQEKHQELVKINDEKESVEKKIQELEIDYKKKIINLKQELEEEKLTKKRLEELQKGLIKLAVDEAVLDEKIKNKKIEINNLKGELSSLREKKQLLVELELSKLEKIKKEKKASKESFQEEMSLLLTDLDSLEKDLKNLIKKTKNKNNLEVGDSDWEWLKDLENNLEKLRSDYSLKHKLNSEAKKNNHLFGNKKKITKEERDEIMKKISELSDLSKAKEERIKILGEKAKKELINKQKELIHLQEKQLKKAIETIENKNKVSLSKKQKKELSDLLVAQKDVIFNNSNESAQRLLQNSKEILCNYFSKEQIEKFCQLQKEICQLEKDLSEWEKNISWFELEKKIKEEFEPRLDKNESNIKNIIVQLGDISIEHSQFAGSVTIGVGEIVNSELNTTNQTKLVEITEEFQTQIETPPKN